MSQRLCEIAHAAVKGKDPIQAEPAQLEKVVEPEAHVQDPVQAEQVAVDLTTFPDIEYDHGEDMVTRKTMTIDRFVPGANQTA